MFFKFFVVKQTGLLDRRQPQAVNHKEHIDHIERDAFGAVIGLRSFVFFEPLKEEIFHFRQDLDRNRSATSVISVCSCCPSLIISGSLALVFEQEVSDNGGKPSCNLLAVRLCRSGRSAAAISERVPESPVRNV